MAVTPDGLWLHIFQSTLPVRGVTDAVPRERLRPDISIHTPREGSDPAQAFCRRGQGRCISIHTPREGSDSKIH